MSAQDRPERAAAREIIAARPDEGRRLRRSPLSGHAHRVEPRPSLPKLPVEVIDVDIAWRVHTAPESGEEPARAGARD